MGLSLNELNVSMLRTERWKLVVEHGTDKGELYDLQAHPTETRNLRAASAQVGEKAAAVRRLCDRLAAMAHPFLRRGAKR